MKTELIDLVQAIQSKNSTNIDEVQEAVNLLESKGMKHIGDMFKLLIKEDIVVQDMLKELEVKLEKLPQE